MGSNRRTNLPQQAPSGPMSRAAAASSKTSAQDGSGVPCPSWFSLRSGARDGQKHLPDRLHTSDNEHDRPKGQLTNPTTENAGNNRMRDLNDQLKQRCRRNRDGNFATQCDRERVLVPVAKQIEDAGLRHLIATSLKPKHQCAAAGIHRMHGFRRQQPADRGHGNSRPSRRRSIGQHGSRSARRWGMRRGR